MKRRGVGTRLLRACALLARRSFASRRLEHRERWANENGLDRDRAVQWIAEEAARFGVPCEEGVALRLYVAAARHAIRSQRHQVAAPERRPRTERTVLPGELAVVTCHFNPAGYRSLRDNYLRFMHEMRWWGVPTFVAEVAYEGQDFVDNDAFLKLRGTDRNVLWQKERLLNLIVEKLPEHFDKVAWIDADVLFFDRSWIQRTREKLEYDPVIQLWNRWHCIDSAGRVGEVLWGVGDDAWRYLSRPACPGGAWAARRSVFPLYDRHILGSGDAMSLVAWCGRLDRLAIKYSSEVMREDFLGWADNAYQKVQGRIGTLESDAIHLHHGSRARRLYVDRWKPALKWGFDPRRHVEVDESGLLAWTASAPQQLRKWVAEYFLVRDEDGENLT